jgi:hypothetical protein
MVGPAAPLRHRTGSGLMDRDEAGAPAASAEGIVADRNPSVRDSARMPRSRKIRNK